MNMEILVRALRDIAAGPSGTSPGTARYYPAEVAQEIAANALREAAKPPVYAPYDNPAHASLVGKAYLQLSDEDRRRFYRWCQDTDYTNV